jgi:phytol kinase
MIARLHDPGLALLSLAAVVALVYGSARAASSGRIAAPALRKALHTLVGAWTLIITPHFHHLAWALVPPVVFLAANASGRTASLLPGVAPTRADARGLWTFPLGVALAYVLFWNDPGRRPLLAGLAALAFADPAAAWLGSRFGQRRFAGFGHGRSLEGSMAFFVVAAVGAAIVAAGAQGGAYPWRMAVICGAAGAGAEAITPSGWDNVAIPLVVAAAYRFFA